ncbi:hypothetical protein Syn7502_02616 [Synechococcus sp. PCC 7502]|uniref:CHAT domain-containing protein n=1 Tax=Synechococcus sp. PCC 7502 TaxID=1173263 RepID=UPI00029FB14C|nr:tetratricopeptide repeat protein [Synechococcus sp. PCC 7502]AFY74578.1 hypothetical protein Syn7502_02616 [Synechococcus sp. PCC 7502]
MSKNFSVSVGILCVGFVGLGLSIPLQLEVIEVSAQVPTDQSLEAKRLLQEGLDYLDINKYAEALQSFHQSLQIYQQIGDRQGIGDVFNNLGITYNRVGQYQKAVEFHQKALAIRKENNDLGGEGTSLNNIGNGYFRLGQYQKAIDLYQQSLIIKKRLGDRNGEATALNGLGIGYERLGQYQKAITFHQESLAIRKETSDLKGEGNSLNNLGVAYKNLGQYQKAIEVYEQSLVIRQEISDINGIGSSLNNLAGAYYNQGQYQKAIAYYQHALAIFEQLGDPNGEGDALNNLGNNYQSLGQYRKAIEFYQQSLAIKTRIGDRQGEAVSLSNIGNTYQSLKQYNKAIEFSQKSLEIEKQLGNLDGQSSSLNNIGSSYFYLKEYQKAISFYQKSLEIKKQLGARQGEANAINNLGLIYREIGQYKEALNLYQQSIGIFKYIGDRQGERNTLNNLGATLAKSNQKDLAILAYKQSVNITESIRKDINGLSKEEQRSYLETIQGGYRRLADLLLQKGRITEALQILDLLKIQELEDYFKGAKKDINQNLAIHQRIKLLAPESIISDRLLTANTTELNRQLANQIAQLPRSEINQVPIYLQKIPKNTALLYPLILSDRLELILFSANNPPINQSVAIKGKDFEELVKDFRSDLQNPLSQDAKISGKKVYDLMIKPLAAQLKQTDTTTILYAPDGILRYIPLAALYDGKQWLVEQYQINNLIAYSLFDSDRQSQYKPQSKISNLRIFAGAFGGKDGESRFGNKGLAGSIPEVENIAKNFTNVTSLLENNFSAKATKEQVIGNAIVHFATHAEFNTGSPLDSYILFGDGSKVTLAEISTWQLQAADLVVLSACETGIGTFGTGAEVLGFGYQVQRAGAKASIASLWTVSDSGTQLLMSGFYQNLQTQNILMALRQSQLAMIKKSIQKGEVSFNHPYFWSSFVVIANSL